MDSKIPLTLTLAILFVVYVVADNCPPKICETAKFKCISQDSCKGTLVPGGANCGCCPSCVPFRVEGESCDIEEIPVSDSKNASSTEQPMPGAEAAKVSLSAHEEKQDKNLTNVCSPGLTCLQGICVVIF